jgi:cytoskeletal protein CcmA (bactofilin family)
LSPRHNRPRSNDAESARGASPSTPTQPDSPTPLVPEGGVWEGQVAVVGQTLVEGCVNGSLRGPGLLILGTSGAVEGIIECEAVETHGRIVGPIIAHTRVHLGPGTRLDGDLETPALEVDDDAIWNGVARVGR